LSAKTVLFGDFFRTTGGAVSDKLRLRPNQGVRAQTARRFCYPILVSFKAG
jgi:hypothetical protein